MAARRSRVPSEQPTYVVRELEGVVDVAPSTRPDRLDEALTTTGAVKLGVVGRVVSDGEKLIDVYRSSDGRAFIAHAGQHLEVLTLFSDGRAVRTASKLQGGDDVGPILADHANRVKSRRGDIGSHEEITVYADVRQSLSREMRQRLRALEGFSTAAAVIVLAVVLAVFLFKMLPNPSIPLFSLFEFVIALAMIIFAFFWTLLRGIAPMFWTELPVRVTAPHASAGPYREGLRIADDDVRVDDGAAADHEAGDEPDADEERTTTARGD